MSIWFPVKIYKVGFIFTKGGPSRQTHVTNDIDTMLTYNSHPHPFYIETESLTEIVLLK